MQRTPEPPRANPVLAVALATLAALGCGAPPPSATTEVNGRAVWAGGENSIAVFAIDQNTGEPRLIQTVRGVGYALREL